MAEDLADEHEHRRLCCDCVGDAFLRSEIQLRGPEAHCSYCGCSNKTFSIGELADEVETAMKEHFYQTPAGPSDREYSMMSEGDYDWERKGDPITFIIEERAQIERKPAEDIQKVLEVRHENSDPADIGDEEPFEEEAHYAAADVDVTNSQASWSHFEQTLKTQARYFSKTAESTLSSIFEGIADHKTRDGRAVIVEAGPDKAIASFYRARVFQSDEKLEEALKRPEKDIGPPPSLAALAGRMNAHGISVFYGATKPMTAIAEVRPPVGSNVVVARFDLTRPVRLLDVEALKEVNMNIGGSIFDRTHLPRLQRAKFLQWISHRIATPVMPDDEPFEYLATQAVADFLASDGNPSLDGILYPSVQGIDGINVVLFHKASKVEPLDVPKGTDIFAQLYFDTEDGCELFPWVDEIVPPKSTRRVASLDSDELLPVEAFGLPEIDIEGREQTLKLDTSDVQIHVVRSVKFETEAFPVHRHRRDDSESPF